MDNAKWKVKMREKARLEAHMEIKQLKAERDKYRDALDSMPHTEYCEYWNECTCGKKALRESEASDG